VAKELERTIGVTMLLTYGSTEYTTSATQPPHDGEVRHGSTGLRCPYTDVKTVQLDASGDIARICERNEPGVVVVKGPGVTPGYVDPRHNVAIFTRDGYFKSGDVGRIDDDGYLWITGRVKDLIIRGGHNIDPLIIEDALKKHPGVLHVAAVGKPDAYAGELPIAYIERVPGAHTSAEELAAFAAEHITERAAAPRDIVLLDRMPFTDIGKPDKVRLRFDAAQRTYYALLSAAVGDVSALKVDAGPDETHGMRITIQLAASDARSREAIERRISDVMKAFSHYYVLKWV
jgi:fatty-acyl-CoA synthase